MNDSDQQKPAGYGHNRKSAAGGAVKNESRVHVTHSGPMQGVADRGGKPTTETFTIDDHEIDIREGETIFRAARRLGIKLPHLCYLPNAGYRQGDASPPSLVAGQRDAPTPTRKSACKGAPL